MVKALHTIEEIAERVAHAGNGYVPLARAGVAASEGKPSAGGNADSREKVDPVAATMAALAEPVNFPALAAGVVSGDQIAITADGDVPNFDQVVLGAVKALEDAGIDHASISIVASDAITIKRCAAAFPEESRDTLHFVVHDPHDKKKLCMVGLTKRGEKIVINRTIFEADVVLPIGCARPKAIGPYSTIFPQFSDAATIDRYRTPVNHRTVKERQALDRETDEAGWMVGVLMIVEVVPGQGGETAHVVAGEPQAVSKKATELAREKWSFEIPHRVGLVVATINGGDFAQTWQNIGQSLALANRLLLEEGGVAICTNLETPPSESLSRLIGAADLKRTARKISYEHAADAEAAWQVARALHRGPVYLLSQLSEDIVEDMGIAPVASIDELVRLAGRQESYVVIEDAQYATVSIKDGADERE